MAALVAERAKPAGAAKSAPRPGDLGRVQAFDGLRAVLVAGVIVYHLAGGRLPSATGEVAVIVFFVLSGFLITTIL
ncbi:MAG: acyltransferase family protein, partial [Acidimicrobiales bacterium]